MSKNISSPKTPKTPKTPKAAKQPRCSMIDGYNGDMTIEHATGRFRRLLFWVPEGGSLDDARHWEPVYHDSDDGTLRFCSNHRAVTRKGQVFSHAPDSTVASIPQSHRLPRNRDALVVLGEHAEGTSYSLKDALRDHIKLGRHRGERANDPIEDSDLGDLIKHLSDGWSKPTPPRSTGGAGAAGAEVSVTPKKRAGKAVAVVEEQEDEDDDDEVEPVKAPNAPKRGVKRARDTPQLIEYEPGQKPHMMRMCQVDSKTKRCVDFNPVPK